MTMVFTLQRQASCRRLLLLLLLLMACSLSEGWLANFPPYIFQNTLRSLPNPSRRHTTSTRTRFHNNDKTTSLAASTPETQSPVQQKLPSGADIEQPEQQQQGGTSNPADAVNDLPRGKVNEIDFTIAPADVSMSRAYGMTSSSNRPSLELDEKQQNSKPQQGDAAAAPTPTLSLTRALNNASNRAVRRILLARSWPSAEALNLSLRRVAQAERAAAAAAKASSTTASGGGGGGGGGGGAAAKCPVPRPILNVLTRKRREGGGADGGASSTPSPRSRTDQEYVADQLRTFRNLYGNLPGYQYAEDYLEAILSLATVGIESESAMRVLQDGIYDESYRRVLGVLRSVGVVWENVGVDDATTTTPQRRAMAKKMADEDICLSMMDMIRLRQEKQKEEEHSQNEVKVAIEDPVAKAKVENEKEMDAPSSDTVDTPDTMTTTSMEMSSPSEKMIEVQDGVATLKPNIKFWQQKRGQADSDESASSPSGQNPSKDGNVDPQLTPEDLGGVLLSAEEPSMTRQLNVLSNIVRRALLFGGDQELLVLAETLDADRPAFCERWYPQDQQGASTASEEDQDETSSQLQEAIVATPGLRYFDSLVLLLRKCYTDGVVKDLRPLIELSDSYANAYEKLVAGAVELGSGYLRPSTAEVFQKLPTPRTAGEELGRFAAWESMFRRSSSSPAPPASPGVSSAYPKDLEGTWEVCDLIGGETIGTTSVTLEEGGTVRVAPPLEGLRWRLDPGPTHLDTCTFQVLSSDDGTILQYRGFLDRGARLEARLSKRAVKMRGSVMFQMRDGASNDYYRDMLPISSYRRGTTQFVMTKKVPSRNS